MLDSLREAFRQAIINFRTELRGGIPDEADALLRAMRQELVALQLQTNQVEVELRRAREEAAREDVALATCLRREALAQQAGDEETGAIARQFAEKHRIRQEILSSKVEVIGRELDERKRSLAESSARFKAAQVQREGLSATAGRADARDRMRGADTLFDEMDRMGDRIRHFEAEVGAAEEVDEVIAGASDAAGARTQPPGDTDLDAQLDALKRELGNR